MNHYYLNTLIVLFISTITCPLVNGQCQNNAAYPGVGIPAPTMPGDTLVVTPFQLAGDYYGMVGFEIGHTYIFSTTNPMDFITLRSSDNQQVIGFGNTPMEYTINEFTDLNVHINLQSPECGTDGISRSSYVSVEEEPVPSTGNKVGINTAEPLATLDVNGKMKISDDDHEAVEGTIRWNKDKKDFQGFDGSQWISFTNSSGKWGPTLIEAVKESDKITASDTTFYKEFGSSIAVYGDYAVIGAFRDSIDGLYDVGAAYIFKKTNNEWTEMIKLTADTPTENANFGVSVAINENHLAVGLPSEMIDGDIGAGSVYTYRLIDDEWIFEEKLQAFTPGEYEQYGSSLALYENRLVVGAPAAKINNVRTGEVYIHQFNNGTNWENETSLSSNDGVSDSRFGASVDIFENTIIVGDPTYPSANNVDVGAAYIYTYANLTWDASELKIVDPFGSNGDFFGTRVSISEDYAAVSSPERNNSFDFLHGSVLTFAREMNWGLDEIIRLNGSSSETSRFGHDIDITGNTLIIANNKKDRDNAVNRGAAYVYKRDDQNWKKEVTLLASDGSAFDQFGSSICINNSTIMIGAQLDELVLGLHTGSVYIFNYCE